MLKAITIERSKTWKILFQEFDFRTKKLILCNNGHVVFIEKEDTYTNIIHKTIKKEVAKKLLNKAESVIQENNFFVLFDTIFDYITLVNENGKIAQTSYIGYELSDLYYEFFNKINHNSEKDEIISFEFKNKKTGDKKCRLTQKQNNKNFGKFSTKNL